MSHNMQKMSCNPTSLSSAENLFPLLAAVFAWASLSVMLAQCYICVCLSLYLDEYLPAELVG